MSARSTMTASHALAALPLTLAGNAPALAEGGGFNPFEFAPGATIRTIVIFLLALQRGREVS